MDKKLHQLKLFLDFYFSPWGAAKGEVWEGLFSYPFDHQSAQKIARDILDGTPPLSPNEEATIKMFLKLEA